VYVLVAFVSVRPSPRGRVGSTGVSRMMARLHQSTDANGAVSILSVFSVVQTSSFVPRAAHLPAVSAVTGGDGRHSARVCPRCQMVGG